MPYLPPIYTQKGEKIYCKICCEIPEKNGKLKKGSTYSKIPKLGIVMEKLLDCIEFPVRRKSPRRKNSSYFYKIIEKKVSKKN